MFSIEPEDRVYVKGSGFLSFAKTMNNRYSQKLLDSAKKSTTDAIKTTSKRTIQKTAEATVDLIANKIAEVPKERYISLENRQQIIDELRLV